MSTTLSVLGVSKRFGDVQALSDVDLTLTAGRIHALVGENGAGKSTLTKILSGLEQPSEGTLQRDGDDLRLHGRGAAIGHGIGLVPQHLSLNPKMTLVDNYLLSQGGVVTRRARAESLLRATADSAGLDIDPRRVVGALPLAQRQFGELTIALAQGAAFLLLDEPTSALGPYETRGLFERITALAEAGTGILLITHRIDEVRLIADDVTVLRGGKVALHSSVDAVTDGQLISAMVGTTPEVAPRRGHALGETALSLHSVSTKDSHGHGLRDVSLSVRAGEVLGVIGVAGNGQRELSRVASGLAAVDSGDVRVAGTSVTGRADLAAAKGLRTLPEERADAVLPGLPLYQTAGLLRVAQTTPRARGIRWPQIIAFTEQLIRRHDVRPPLAGLPIDALSGGNQQKLLVGRELDDNPAVCVLHGPTQGLDVHAAAAIRDSVLAAAESGTAVLLISADVEEIAQLADRVAVLTKGEISDTFAIEDLTADRLGAAMSGVTRADGSPAAEINGDAS